jgi:nucleoside-diphosphate-sugar epimerase
MLIIRQYEYTGRSKKGKGYVFGSGENKINPIHGADLAEVCVNAAVGDKKEIKVGGPDIFSHNEILRIALNTLNKDAKISRITFG